MIEWSEELALGVASIDEQHRELVKRFNMLLTACNEGKGGEQLRSTLEFLRNYVVEHFRDEERLQIRSGYPGYVEHQEKHREFVKKLSMLREQFNDEGASLPLIIKTNNTLVDWLVTHIRRDDQKVGAHIRLNEGTA
jgi:hemerythrin